VVEVVAVMVVEVGLSSLGFIMMSIWISSFACVLLVCCLCMCAVCVCVLFVCVCVCVCAL
jgi:hypothetical protein